MSFGQGICAACQRAYSIRDDGMLRRHSIDGHGNGLCPGSEQPPSASAREGARTWVIEVCRTCDRLAQWPFCEHRDETGRWYELVTVRAD